MEKVLASGVAKPARFQLHVTCAGRLDRVTFVNYVTRKDDCRSDHRGEKFRVTQFYPDLVPMNEVKIREDYELGHCGWLSPVLTIESVIGSPSELMADDLKKSYRWVKIIRFNKDFSSVFALMSVVSSLENCRQVYISLNERNIAKTSSDLDIDAYGSSFLCTLKSTTIRSFFLLKSRDSVIGKNWVSKNSRVNLISKLALLLFPNLEELVIDTFGNIHDYREITATISAGIKPCFLPHMTTFNGDRIIMKIDRTKLTRKRIPLISIVPPQHAPYMSLNESFVAIGQSKEKNITHVDMTKDDSDSTSSPYNTVVFHGNRNLKSFLK